MLRRLQPKQARCRAKIYPAEAWAVVRQLAVVRGERLHGTVPPGGRDRRQSPPRTGVGQHLLVERGVVGHDNMTVQDSRELAPYLYESWGVRDSAVRDPVNGF